MKLKTQKTKKPEIRNGNPTKRLAILNSAEDIFAKKGFSKTTISEIAKKAKISDATIYEYFSSKEELLFSIPAEISLEYQHENRKMLKYIQGAANKLRFLVFRHLELYTLNPNYAKISTLILKTNRNFLRTKAYKVVQASARDTILVLEEGIKNGEFHSKTDPYLVRSMIWGTIEHLVIRKSLLGKPANLLEFAEKICYIIFEGILASEPETDLNINVNFIVENQKHG